jgi:hypothetical protein
MYFRGTLATTLSSPVIDDLFIEGTYIKDYIGNLTSLTDAELQ